MTPSFRSIRRFVVGRGDLLREVDDEISFHLESAARDLMAAGFEPEPAREEARRRFGDTDGYRRACHRIDRRALGAKRRGELVHDLLADLSVAARSLRRSKSFLLTTVATLAVAILAVTAVYSVVHAVLQEPLPLPGGDRWMLLVETNPEFRWADAPVAPANLFDWRQRSTSFDAMTAYIDNQGTLTLTGEGEPELVVAQGVLDDFMAQLGIAPALGPGFDTGNTFAADEKTVALSFDFWQRRFGGDPKILGRVLTLDGEARTVVAVMPRGFSFPVEGIEAWIPLRWSPEDQQAAWFRRAHFLRAIGRLAPGVSPRQAAAELEVIAGQLSEEYPEFNRVMGATLMPLREWIVGRVRRPLAILLAAVAVVLLVACLNVASLQVARALPRTREIAIRRALGAGRGRIVRQLLTESLLLALLGCAVGIPAGLWATRALVRLAPEGLPRAAEIAVSRPVILWVLAATLATMLLFGLIPALRFSGIGAQASLRQASGTGTGRQRVRGLLIASEIALAVLLVAGSGLLVRSLFSLQRVDAGFDPEGVLTAGVFLPKEQYPAADQIRSFFEQLRDRAAALPGVETAATTDQLPLSGTNWTSGYSIEGATPAAMDTSNGLGAGGEIHHRTVSESYFQTLRVPLAAGRFFDATDGPDSAAVVVINQTLARQLFGDESPLGRRITFDRPASEDSTWRTIIGVAGDELIDALDAAPRPEVLALDRQDADRSPTLLLRTSVPPLSVLPALRELVHQLDSDLPLEEPRTLSQHVDATLTTERFLTVLVLLFADLALALAMLGIYGLTAYTVHQRHREIGIRLALGAKGRQVAAMLLRQTALLTLLGLAAGLTLAVLTGRALEGQLYGVGGADPVTFAAVAAAVAGVALLASYLPARRAARIDPAVTLRQE
jgi:predicted permease